MKVTVEAVVMAPVEVVWAAWTTPEDICAWNAASDDWHTVRSVVDLRVGGRFNSRMEAKDGSFGFDFEGVYTRVKEHVVLEAMLGDRALLVEFEAVQGGTRVRETFDAEDQNPVEMQRQGWQAILDNFKRHVEAS